MHNKNGIKKLQIYTQSKGMVTARTPNTIAWLINTQGGTK